MILVMITVAIAMVLGLSFLNGQAIATGLAQNVVGRASARGIAESGLNIAIAYVRNSADWRTAQSNGTWLADHAFASGSFTLRFDDEQDGDLTDDDEDPITLTVIGRANGVAHKIAAVVTPGPLPIDVLFVVPNSALLDSGNAARKTLLEDWDMNVTLIDESDTLTNYNAAFPSNDVVYVSSTTVDTNVGSKLTDAPIGVVLEQSDLSDEMGIGSGGFHYFSSETIIVDNSHYITETFGLGALMIVPATQHLRAVDGTPPAGAQMLAQKPSGTRPALLALEAGEAIYTGSRVPARRIFLPWGGITFDFTALNGNGRILLKRSLIWGAESPQVSPIDVGLAVSDELELPDDGVIDSFNSAAGPYGGLNVGASAVISTNSTSANRIRATDNALVKGSAYAGPGGNPSVVINVTGGADITGVISMLSDAIPMPTVTEPTGLPPSVGNVTYSSGTTTISSDLHCDNLVINGSAVVQISGDVVILCEGWFSMEESSALRILADSTLTLYTKDKNGSDAVHFDDDAQFNVNTGDPGLATIYVMSTGECDMDRSPDVYARVVAPNGELDVNDDTNYYGTFLGRRIVVEQRGQLHHDLGVSPYPDEVATAASTGPPPKPTFSVRWIEQP